jgi:hypothetical protein
VGLAELSAEHLDVKVNGAFALPGESATGAKPEPGRLRIVLWRAWATG